MNASEVIAELSAFLNRSLIPFFFGILDNPNGVLVLAVATDVLEGVPEGGPEPAENLREMDAVSSSWFDSCLISYIKLSDKAIKVLRGQPADT